MKIDGKAEAEDGILIPFKNKFLKILAIPGTEISSNRVEIFDKM